MKFNTKATVIFAVAVSFSVWATLTGYQEADISSHPVHVVDENLAINVLYQPEVPARHSLMLLNESNQKERNVSLPEPRPQRPPPPAPPLPTTAPPTHVLLLSYQRTGSSFLGGLFRGSGAPPGRVFYLFEPLDAVYSAMYGTDPGWNVPSDIRTHGDGREREIPTEELEAIDLTLEHIYSCSTSQLPVAMLLHNFWFKFKMSAAPYVSCLAKHSVRISMTLNMCRANIRATCSGHFNGDSPRLVLCRDVLYNGGKWSSSVEELASRLSTKQAASFRRYFSCLAAHEQATRTCAVLYIDQPCKTAQVRVVKTVRAGAKTAERLLRKSRQVKVIHSFRDPRGASRSRSLTRWARGKYEGSVLGRIAQCYCRSVLKDHRLLEALKIQYPGRLLTVIFDDYVQRPNAVSKDILTFSDVTLTGNMLRRLLPDILSLNHPPKSSVIRNTRWTERFKMEQISIINKACLEFFSEVQFDWPSIS